MILKKSFTYIRDQKATIKYYTFNISLPKLSGILHCSVILSVAVYGEVFVFVLASTDHHTEPDDFQDLLLAQHSINPRRAQRTLCLVGMEPTQVVFIQNKYHPPGYIGDKVFQLNSSCELL